VRGVADATRGSRGLGPSSHGPFGINFFLSFDPNELWLTAPHM
jgi:hypothetical protein